VEQLVAYLSELRQYTPTEDEYKKLCLLVTSPRLQDHQEYRNWNPASGRLQCFKEILPFVAKFLEPSKDPNIVTHKPQQIAQNERLVQLLVKVLMSSFFYLISIEDHGKKFEKQKHIFDIFMLDDKQEKILNSGFEYFYTMN
jgi:hypothetical protein